MVLMPVPGPTKTSLVPSADSAAEYAVSSAPNKPASSAMTGSWETFSLGSFAGAGEQITSAPRSDPKSAPAENVFMTSPCKTIEWGQSA